LETLQLKHEIISC